MTLPDALAELEQAALLLLLAEQEGSRRDMDRERLARAVGLVRPARGLVTELIEKTGAAAAPTMLRAQRSSPPPPLPAAGVAAINLLSTKDILPFGYATCETAASTRGTGGCRAARMRELRMSATAMRIIAPAMIVITPIDSPSTTAPSTTATSGLTYA
jgi:hypothetical protein